jgi:hypothetical protein
MRLRVFGVPKIILIAFGLFPLALWSAFHFNAIWFRKEEAYWFLSLGIILCSVFTYCFRRGLFAIRYLIYGAIVLEILAELVPSAMERDFVTHGWALLALLVSIAAGNWLEKKVGAAYLNPGTQWFEGAPKILPRVEARIKMDQEWVGAGVRRIDEQGLFLLVEAGTPYRRGQTMEFELNFAQEKVRGNGRLRSCFLGEKLGFGLQFLPEDLYHFSQYTSLVKRLRGEGL